MTTRTDVVIEYTTSPRVVEVNAPSTEMIMQDWVDTNRKLEDSFQGMAFTKLLNASGKEDLGGGVSVGITAASQDNLLSFAARTTPAETGTVTSNPGSPVAGRDSFIDTTATFQANNVARGSLVVNFTDNSIADVVSVDGETQLTTKTLVNGIGNTFDTADVYHVFNIIQCNATGGNLTAVDTVPATISPILPTAFTQIILTASSSATTQNQALLEFATFNGHIHWAFITGKTSITETTDGNEETPLKELDDVKTQAVIKGFDEISVVESATVIATDDLTNFSLVGVNSSQTVLTFVAGSITGNTQFTSMELIGDLSGALFIDRCQLTTLTGIGSITADTVIRDTIFSNGTITLRSDNNKLVHILNCSSSGSNVTLDVNGTTGAIHIHHYLGLMTLSNVTSEIIIAFDGPGGRLSIDSSCTAGTINVSGATTPIDNSGPGCTVNDLTVPTKVWDFIINNYTTSQIMQELHQRGGLDAANPLVTKENGDVDVDSVDINANTTGTTPNRVTTQTRQ